VLHLGERSAMKDQDKTKQELISELDDLRRRLKELEASRNGTHSGNERRGPDDALWHSLVSNTPVVIVIVDENLCIRFTNHTDSGADANQVLGKSLCDFCGPEHRETVRERVQYVFQTGKPCVYECPVLRLDEQEHWYASHCGPIFADGRVVAVSLIATNITKQRQAEKELATSKAILRAAIDSLPFDFGALGLDGRYMLQNAAGRANWGDSIGRLPEEMCKSEDELATWLENHRRALGGEKVEGDVELTIGGEKRFCHHVTVPIWDEGCIRGVLGVNIDITDRKRAEEALQKAHDELDRRVEQRTAELSAANGQLRIFRMFAEASSQGFGMADMEGRITYMNPALCRMASVAKPEDAIGRNLSAYYPEGYMLKREREILPALMQKGHWEGELVGSPGGKTIYGLQHSFLIKDENGKPFCLASVITDITERRQTEEALERERQSLWHMLQASDHERQIISYEIHDGLAQYLAAAGMQLQVFDRLHGSDPERAQKAYEAAVQLVSKSHFEARRLISEVRPPIIDEIGLETAVSHLVHERRRRGGPKIEFHSDVQFGRLPAILENSLYRIAQEALTNACKHSRSRKVTVTLTQAGQEVRLEVQDWGIGFAPESVEKGHFGLEGIRQRVRLLGGQLTTQSRPGSGTLVQAVVPIVEKQGEA
jgi:PAS domain S-box-containing protein